MPQFIDWCRQHGVALKETKSQFAVTEVVFSGISPIEKWPTDPSNLVISLKAASLHTYRPKVVIK